MSHDEAPRHTGTVPRGPLRRQPPPSDPRLGWALVVGALVVGSVAVAWVLGATGTRGTATTASPSSAALAPTSSPTSGAVTTPDAIKTPEAINTPLRTTAPLPVPAATASPVVTLEPTPESTAEPTPDPTRGPQAGLAIDFPADDEVVRSRVINVVGTAPSGATITRDIPLWFDAHTTVRADGIWMLPVELSEGDNALTFRIGDDRSTEIRFTVTYRPGG